MIKSEIIQKYINRKVEALEFMDNNELFVAISIRKGDDLKYNHSCLLVNSSNGPFLFDYNPPNLVCRDLNEDDFNELNNNILLFLNTDHIIDGEVDAFLVWLKGIVKNNKHNIRFGYFLPENSRFDEFGMFKSDSNVKLLLTCVGVCLLALNSFDPESIYLNTSEWPSATEESEEYCETYTSLFDYDSIEDLANLEWIKRISPIQFYSSAILSKEDRYFNMISKIYPTIREYISS